MKIAILTLPINVNYGGILQGYALKTILERQGHNVYFFNLCYSRPVLLRRFLKYCKERVLFYCLGKKTMSRKEWLFICNKINRFNSQYMNLSSPLYTVRELHREFIKFQPEMIIYGSDQIWSSFYAPHLGCYFGEFLHNSDTVKQLAYAASFGNSNGTDYSVKQLNRCKELLKRFTAVSVREISGVNICKNKFEIAAQLVLDPTLLLDEKDYRNLINATSTEPSKGNMHVYILDESEEKEKLINQISAENRLIPFYSNVNIMDEDIPIGKRCYHSVEQWLRSFCDASLVVTDSFHGCVFSILFKKNFIAIGNIHRGLDRFLSLLDLLSLRDRLILSFDEYENRKEELQKNIDFDMVYSKLNKERLHSMEFIKSYC